MPSVIFWIEPLNYLNLPLLIQKYYHLNKVKLMERRAVKWMIYIYICRVLFCEKCLKKSSLNYSKIYQDDYDNIIDYSW